jgi:fibrillarin-like pre-rRNA processing protein
MDVLRVKKEVLPNTFIIEYKDREMLATRSNYPPHYGEKKIGEYREWIPFRSKFAGMILNNHIPEIRKDFKLLYLGTATGTTASHLSDILSRGIIYGVEYSAIPFKKFLELAMERENIIPLLENAEKPENYSGMVEEVDFIYQDISQRNQLEIFERNTEFFLRRRGEGIIMVKARSIDSTAEPSSVFKKVLMEMEIFDILKHGSLEPYHKDHIFVHIRK